MKRVLIFLINCYQKIPGKWHSSCRFVPTCSEYAKIAIDRFGSIKGSYLAIKRILKCNPFNKGGIDLVPIKESRIRK